MTIHSPPTADLPAEPTARSRRGTLDGSPNAVSTIVAGALDAITEVTAVGLAVLDASGTVRTLEATGPAVESLHASESHLGEGPCVDALPGLGPAPGAATFTHLPDLNAGGRWPRWSWEARAVGYREVLSFPMAGNGGYVALTFYVPGTRCLAARDVSLGALFAEHLGDLLSVSGGHDEHSADPYVVHHATGVLAERHLITPGQAFGLLVAMARETGHDLPTAARRVSTGARAPHVAASPPSSSRSGVAGADPSAPHDF